MLRMFKKLGLAAFASTRRHAQQTEADRRQSLVSQVIWKWPAGEPIRVDVALERYPDLIYSDQALIDLAIEEFNDRRDSGEELTATGFADRFPDIRSRLLDSLLFEHALGEMTGFFRSVLVPARDGIKWPIAGDTIAGFDLMEPLGQGGFSRVYVAQDLEHDRRQVALKICRNVTHELTALKHLQHTCIGTVHYTRSIDELGMTAICMPLVTRTTLQDVIGDGQRISRPRSAAAVWQEVRRRNSLQGDTPTWAQLSFVDWAVDLTIKLCRALQASHDQKIIHCDLKPTNVLVSPEGSPLLVDFNVAFQKSAAEGSAPTSSPKNIGGTLPYMAPEQIRAFAGKGFSEITPQTDLFGLGATVYELLTGRMPYRGPDSSEDGIRRLLEERRQAPDLIRKHNHDVSPELEQLLMSCLSYDPACRPASAETLARQLEKLQETRRVRVASRPHRVAAGLAAVAVVTLAVVLQPNARERENGVAQTPAVAGMINLGLTPSQVDQIEATQVDQLVADGYTAFERSDYKRAEQIFQKALNRDPGHAGAFLGRIRAAVFAGHGNDVFPLAIGSDHEGIGEKAALHGLCFAATNRHTEAIQAFESARRFGLETPELETALACSLYMSGQREDGYQLLSRVLESSDTIDNATPKLLMARMLFDRGMQQRAMTRDTSAEFPYEVEIVDLIEQCPDSPARGFVASTFYAAIGNVLKSTSEDEWELWGKRAVAEFERGERVGLPTAYWHTFNRMLAPTVQAGERAVAWSETPATRVTNHLVYHLPDPLIGTRFERWTRRDLLADADRSNDPKTTTGAVAALSR